MGNPRKYSISVCGLLLWVLSPFALAQVSEDDGAAVAETETLPAATESIDAYLIFDRPLRLDDGLDPVQASEGRGAAMTAPESEDLLLQRIAEIGSHQAAITELELAGGAWNASLAEELTAMGGLYQAQGTHVEAIGTLSRAMQINRINHGLDSLQQVPVVEKLIDSYLAQGEWGKADQYQSYLYYVQRKAFGNDDPRMIPVLNSLARWNLQLFQVGYGEALGLRLSNAYTLFKAASQIVNVHFGSDDERYVSYLKEMASSAYLVSRNQGLMEEASRPEYRSVQAMYAERMRQIDPIHAQGYREGEEALRQIVEHYERRQGNARQHAQALAELGDWYLIFERRRAAADQYRLAYELLSEQAQGQQLIDELFGHVVPLPAFSGSVEEMAFNPVVPETEGRELRSGYADVAVEVNDYGLVSNVDVLSAEITEEDARVHTLLRRKVRSSVFRPKLENGEMVRSVDNRFRYHYRY
ncbi:MAG: hypothetical protein RLZZ385_2694 [Pseudomonadota bacterium]